MSPEAIEKFAIQVALGNNGGVWSTHYTEEHKEHWRKFIKDLVDEITKGVTPK
jgi:exosome complex RNA-binding protein Rrp4